MESSWQVESRFHYSGTIHNGLGKPASALSSSDLSVIWSFSREEICLYRKLVPRALFWPVPSPFFYPCGFKTSVILCSPSIFQFQASILFTEINFLRSFWSCEKFWGFLSVRQKLYHRPLSMLWLMLRCFRDNTLKLPRHLLIWVKR